MKEKPPVTAIFSIRADVRDVATVALAFDTIGVPYTSKSNLIGLALQDYAQLLVEALREKGKEVQFNSTKGAEEFVGLHQNLKIKNVRIGGKNLRSALKQRVLENLTLTDDGIEKRASELLNATEEDVEEVDDKGIPEHLQKEKQK